MAADRTPAALPALRVRPGRLSRAAGLSLAVRDSPLPPARLGMDLDASDSRTVVSDPGMLPATCRGNPLDERGRERFGLRVADGSGRGSQPTERE
jgi:hypothetical protein